LADFLPRVSASAVLSGHLAAGLTLDKLRGMDEAVIRREECQREVDEFTVAAEEWVVWSDGRNLLPYASPAQCVSSAAATEQRPRRAEEDRRSSPQFTPRVS
jgi:hypothetical protein